MKKQSVAHGKKFRYELGDEPDLKSLEFKSSFGDEGSIYGTGDERYLVAKGKVVIRYWRKSGEL